GNVPGEGRYAVANDSERSVARWGNATKLSPKHIRPDLVKPAGQQPASEQDHLLTLRHCTLGSACRQIPRRRWQGWLSRIGRVSLRLYDTGDRAVREFVPRTEGRVGIYLCGATVQAAPHIGHIRSGVNFDVLRRYLEYRGLQVTFCRNVTDI